MPMKRPPTTLELDVGENVANLMDSNEALNTEKKVAAATTKFPVKVTQTTVGRTKKAHHSAKLETIEAIAQAYGVPAWQLLFPKLDVHNPPIVISGLERLFYLRFRETMNEWRQGESEQKVPSDHDGGLPNSQSKGNKQGRTRGSETKTPAQKKARSAGIQKSIGLTKQVTK